MGRHKRDKNSLGDIGFSLGNPLQGLSDVILGCCGCNCGCDNGNGNGNGNNTTPIFIFCCIGGGSGHLIDESEIVL